MFANFPPPCQIEPWQSDDAILEAACSVADPDWGPPESWPSWTDMLIGDGPALDPSELVPDEDPVPPRDPESPLWEGEDKDDYWLEIDDDDSGTEWPIFEPPAEDERRGWCGHPGNEHEWLDSIDRF